MVSMEIKLKSYYPPTYERLQKCKIQTDGGRKIPKSPIRNELENLEKVT